MITREEIVQIGRLNHPHGVKGEINAIISVGIDPQQLSCIVLDMDGIFVPFFIEASRQRGTQAYLLTIAGIENEQKASAIANRTIYALSNDMKELQHGEEEDGFYADDLVGYTISSTDGALHGTITDIDDSTENVLFIVTTNAGKTHLVPVADELITDIDTDKRHLTVEIPDGLLDI